MLWELLRRGHAGRILAACCVRSKSDLAYLATHEPLMAMFERYTYVGMTTRDLPPDEPKLYIQDFIATGQLEKRLGAALDPASTHVFLYGNPKMIGIPDINISTGERSFPRPAGAIEVLEKRGFQMDVPRSKFRGKLHFESFW